MDASGSHEYVFAVASLTGAVGCWVGGREVSVVDEEAFVEEEA